MSLPDCIEITPLPQPVNATINVPGSKSITNRALVLAALAERDTVLTGALWSEDTQVMVDCLRRLQFRIEVEPDPRDSGNRKITVGSQGGRIGPGGSLEHPLELPVANSGTTARFLTALTCLGRGVYRLLGSPRMHERPQEGLFDALRELGYCIDSVNSRLPADVHGGGIHSGTCCVSIEQSSQFASALLLCAKAAGWNVRVVGANPDESPYVKMTSQLAKAFPQGGGEFAVEPDASSASYFWAAQTVQPATLGAPGHITVADHPKSGWQVDARFPGFLPLPEQISRQSDLGDSIMTAIILAPLASHPVRFTDLGPLRVQECERVQALHKELARCGAALTQKGDTLQVKPSPLHGAEIGTYQDHRMAMCFSILGLKVPGMKIKNPACVNKSFPHFYRKLAAAPPDGLGATILNAATGKALLPEELVTEPRP